MKYKTMFYDVTAFANRLPDDCLQIIAKFAYDESRYKYLERIPKLSVYEVWSSFWLRKKCNYSCVKLTFPNSKLCELRYYDDSGGCYYVNIYEYCNHTCYNFIQQYKLINNCWEQLH